MTAWKESYKLKDGSTHWRVRQRVGKGQTSVTVGASEDLADKKETVLEAEKIQGRVGIQDNKKTVREHIEAYLNYSRLTKSKRTYWIEYYSLQPLKVRLGHQRLVDVDSRDVRDFMLELLKTRKVNGVKLILRVVHACFEYAGLQKNPASKVDVLQDVEVARKLSDEELNKLFSVCTNTEFKEIMLIALNTGMREGEIIALDRQKHFYGNCIRIERHEMKNRRTKAKRPKVIPITEPISFLLEKKGKIYKDWTKDRIESSLRWWIKKSGLKGRIRFHDFKHTFCSNWKGDLATLAEITGNTWQTLQKYVHSDEEKLRTAMERSSFSWGENGVKNL